MDWSSDKSSEWVHEMGDKGMKSNLKVQLLAKILQNRVMVIFFAAVNSTRFHFRFLSKGLLDSIE